MWLAGLYSGSMATPWQSVMGYNWLSDQLLLVPGDQTQCHRIDRAVGRIVQAASDWPTGILSTAPFSLTRSRG